MQRLVRSSVLPLLLLCALPARAQLVLTEGTNISVDVSRADGRIATDLLGSIWIIGERGGDAERISRDMLPARSPRWSPDGRTLVYQTTAQQQSQIRKIDMVSGDSELLSDAQYVDQQPAWNPDGARIVFSSERGDSGFDLWELDLATRLSWRITSQPGDESAPAWSGNGRHLAYVHRQGGRWSLMIRRFGQPDEVLVDSAEPIFAPSWRPDGSLLTYLQHTPDGLVVKMVILSDPPLVRTLMSGEDFFVSPVSWLDRYRFFYTSNGGIRTRNFNEWKSRQVHFAAAIDSQDQHSRAAPVHRSLQVTTPSPDRLVIRTARLFDGSDKQYSSAVDVLLEGGRISAMRPRREWPEAVVLDLGDATLLPGFIDSYSSLSSEDPRRIGAELLSYGVTAIVSADRADIDGLLWESPESPGPRLLRAKPVTETPQQTVTEPVVLATVPANGGGDLAAFKAWQALGIPVMAESWTTGVGLGADLLMGLDSLPTSPLGNRYQDIQAIMGSGPITLLSGLADAATPGLPDLLGSRQAVSLGRRSLAVRRYAVAPGLSERNSFVVLGSKPSGLPAGIALHAELRALEAAGLPGDEVLKSAGIHAATALRLDGQLGVIAPGAVADLVLVAGDPLRQISDAMNIVAVVRNGRFYSLSSLLERAEAAASVE